MQVDLTLTELNTVIFALRSKAEADEARAEELNRINTPVGRDLAEVFLAQVRDQRALADRLDAAEEATEQG